MADGKTDGGSLHTVEVPVEVDEFDSNVEEVAPTTLILPPEFTAVARLLTLPQELAEDWVAEEEVKKYLPKKTPKDAVRLEKGVKHYEALLDLQSRKVVKVSA